MIKLNVLGSCVSRVILLDGNQSAHGIADDNLQLEYFLDKTNIVCSMMPKPFSDEEVEKISAEELYDPKRIRHLKQGLKKQTLQMILDSEAEYLIIDLYDFHNDIACFKNTCFSTCAHEFFNTSLFKAYREEVGIFNFLKTPIFMWYSYVDLFFQKVIEKYDKNHIILNRFRSNSHYFGKNGEILEIPKEFKQPYHSNDCYNTEILKLEDYIINKYGIYSIDLSEYFIGDATYWDNLNGAHFQREFYTESFKILKQIVFKQPEERVFDTISFGTVLNILNRDNLNKDSFEKYISVIRKPRTGYLPLDDALSCLSDDSISANRMNLSHIYEVADKIKEILLESEKSSVDKANELLSMMNLQNNFINNFGQQIKIAAEYHDCDDIQKLFDMFNDFMNSENLLWIKVIDRMEQLAPCNKDVVFLKLQYYKAIENKEFIALYTKKYNEINKH